MKITVYFTYGDILECEEVRDSRKFWRYVSKYCKRVSSCKCYEYVRPQRVIKVIKEVKT